MTGNLIGENLDRYVVEQIDQRQTLQGKGYKNTRSSTDINILSNNNSFIKLASGVDIFKAVPPQTREDLENRGELQEEVGTSSGADASVSEAWDNLKEIKEQNKEKIKTVNGQIEENNKIQAKAATAKLKRLGFSENEIKKFKNSNVLAKSSVLFNGLSSLEDTKLKQRFGINTSKSVWNSTKAYGLGGSSFGKQPMPGIVSADIKCVNRGSIRSATVQIKAFNQFQFDLLELLYMRLGFTMMLEWGHISFIDNQSQTKTNIGSTYIENEFFKSGVKDQREVLDGIEALRAQYSGNYDGFFGRVTNFSWNFGPDGTYDIELELYTLGDVVESLTINVPAASLDLKTQANSIQSEAQKTIGNYTILEKWMDSYMAEKGADAVSGDGKYINLVSNNFTSGKRLVKVVEGWGENNENPVRVYCTFKELLNRIVEYCIPLVVGRTTYPMVDFDLSENMNIVSAQPNQISYDLEVCFVKPKLFASGILVPSTYTDPYFKNYFVLDTENDADLYYGQLMNLYLNFKFIKQQLKKNTDKEGNLSLYKFLVGICDGINSALGDVNKIQPIIKNDNEIVFIDQVQPKGNESILSKLIPTTPKQKVVPFELYGYNSSNGITKSNFIYNFSFESKIDANLATSLAIGATAGNSSTALTDGTAFASWNSGLQDRFTPEIIPPIDDIDVEAISKAEEEKSDEELYKLWNGEYDGVAGYDAQTTWYNDIFRSEDTRSGTIGKFTFPRSTFSEFKEKYLKFLNRNIQSKAQFQANLKGAAYQQLLAYFFSGPINKVENYSVTQGQYLNIANKTIFQQLKQAFKKYIQLRDEKIFKVTNTSSRREGFIPLNLKIDMMGLSGVKIYQKLPIVTRFLPTQYTSGGTKDDLSFIIQSVDHSISDSKWSTSITTLSIPRSVPTSVELIDNGLFTFLDMAPAAGTFAGYVNRDDVPWSACFISWLSKSNGINFPYNYSHALYSSAIKSDSSYGWTFYNPMEGSTASLRVNRINTVNNRIYITEQKVKRARNFGQGEELNLSTYSYDGSPSFGGVQVGDIIVYNRTTKNPSDPSTNILSNNKFKNSSYVSATHGDIVYKVDANTIYVIGGNVNNTVAAKTYTIGTKAVRVKRAGTSSLVIRSNSNIKPEGNGQNVFVALRPPADKAQILANAAVAAYSQWSSNGWNEKTEAAWPTLREYYLAGNMIPPELPSRLTTPTTGSTQT